MDKTTTFNFIFFNNNNNNESYGEHFRILVHPATKCSWDSPPKVLEDKKWELTTAACETNDWYLLKNSPTVFAPVRSSVLFLCPKTGVWVGTGAPGLMNSDIQIGCFSCREYKVIALKKSIAIQSRCYGVLREDAYKIQRGLWLRRKFIPSMAPGDVTCNNWLIGMLLVSRLGLVEEDTVDCYINMISTCPLLSQCKISRSFRENNNVVVFPFPFHVFMTLAKLWFIRLQG